MNGNAKIVVVVCILGLVTGLGVLGCGSKPKPEEQAAPGAAAAVPPPKSEAVKPVEPAKTEPVKVAEPAKPAKPGVPEPATVRKCAAAPVIDGDLSDDCWKDAEVKGVWADIRSGKAADPQPKVFVCYDDQNLYIAFQNPEPKMDKIVAAVTDRDGTTYTDDSNEVFIDPTAGKKEYYQFIVNTKGVVYDGKGKDADWNGHAKVAVKKMDDAWCLEIAVPLSDIGVEGSPKGQTWTANFCRNRLTEGEAQALGWADTGESFHNPAAFGKLKME
jgi:hypothetical protein